MCCVKSTVSSSVAATPCSLNRVCRLFVFMSELLQRRHVLPAERRFYIAARYVVRCRRQSGGGGAQPRLSPASPDGGPDESCLLFNTGDGALDFAVPPRSRGRGARCSIRRGPWPTKAGWRRMHLRWRTGALTDGGPQPGPAGGVVSASLCPDGGCCRQAAAAAPVSATAGSGSRFHTVCCIMPHLLPYPGYQSG